MQANQQSSITQTKSMDILDIPKRPPTLKVERLCCPGEMLHRVETAQANIWAVIAVGPHTLGGEVLTVFKVGPTIF